MIALLFLGVPLAYLLGVLIVTLVLHELVHGLCFWSFTRDRPRFGWKLIYAYAAAPGWYLPRGRYLTVALENAGCVTADPRMTRAVELSRCVVDAFPSTPAARDFRKVAGELQYWPMRPAMSRLPIC